MSNFIPFLDETEIIPSPFVTGDDNIHRDLFVDRMGTFDEIDISLFEDCITDAAKEIATEKFDLDFQQELEFAILQGVVNAIISVTGDDEIICTNSKVLPLLHFVGAQILSGIKLSRKDTGISAKKGNYAEGWIIMPPNKEAAIDNVQRLHSGSGIALVLDMLKLKLLSAVRKQSILETDFESKYTDLHKSVEWIDKDWFTYDYGQCALVFATAIFDLRESVSSPFLYKTEGGTGGLPPWNNLETALAGIHHQSRGKAVQSVLHLMDEATCIQKGTLKPSDATFIQASHLVQGGNFELEKMANIKATMEKLTKKEKLEILEDAKGADPIPLTLKEKSVIIEPKDKLLGCAISELRKNGLVMTELDVQTLIASRKKLSALFGSTNMGQVIRETEEELRKAKRDAFRIIKTMGTSPDVIPITNYRKVMSEYYSVRKDRSDVTAFSYAGQIRVFKSSDVKKEFELSIGGLKDEIISGMLATRNYRLSHKIGKEREKVEYQIDWMESGEITDLFEGEFPPGIGTDDARILRKLTLSLPLTDITVFIIMSDDKDMMIKLKLFAAKHPLMYVEKLGKFEYMKECMINARPRQGEGAIYNFLTGKYARFNALTSILQRFGSWRRTPRFKIIWDFPNINRGIEPIEIRRDRKGNAAYAIPNGGYLRRKTVISINSWASLPWEEFKKFPDFQIQTNVIRDRKFRI